MKLYTAKEIAILWGVSSQAVRKYLKDGRIPNAILENGTWMIPEGSEKPGLPPREQPEMSPLMKRILYQKVRNNHFGIYEYLQINMAYSSNRLASNRLTRVQMQALYRTDRIIDGFEPATVDDVIEVANHFMAMDLVLDTVQSPITLSYCKNLHRQLTYGTYADRFHQLDIGAFRKKETRANKGIHSHPADINKSLTALLKSYEKEPATLERIVGFHVQFERIRPFDDYNGRVGRLLMIKECLRNNIDPFIIDDKRRSEYTRGIAAWDTDPEILMNAVRESQHRFQSKMEVCKLMQYDRFRKF